MRPAVDQQEHQQQAKAAHHQAGQQLEQPAFALAQLAAAQRAHKTDHDEQQGQNVDQVVEQEVKVVLAGALLAQGEQASEHHRQAGSRSACSRRRLR